MPNKESELLLSKLLLVGPAAVTLFVFTSGATDPVNANKLFLLGAISFAAISTLSLRSIKMIWREHRILILALVGFIIASVNSLLQSQSPTTQQIYGVYGRNNGFLLYLFLVIFFVATLTFGRSATANYIVKSLVIAGTINLLYCAWVLLFGDFLGWTNPYGNILGTLGNPNFIGAFLGMFSSILVSLAIANSKNIKHLVIILAGLAVTVIEIVNSHAIQGRVLFVLGLVVNCFYWIRSKSEKLAPQVGFITFAGVGGLFALLGTLQIGPLTNLLYKESVSLRGEYWHAGLTMAKSHLFSGVGFDSYGDWYRNTRRASALIKPGPETVSNASHNVVIDIFSFGGLPLLCAYLVIVVLVLTSIVKFSISHRNFDYIFVSLAGAWLCFQLQSIISINQVGLAVWGWVLGAAIIAYERITRHGKSIEPPHLGVRPTKLSSAQAVSPGLRAGIATVLGVLIAVPPFAADIKWRSAQESRDAAKIEEVLSPSYFNPGSSFKYLQLVGAFEQSNLPDLAHKYAIEAVKFNPHSYESWRLFTLIRKATPQEKQLALVKMKELDPLNPGLAMGNQ